VAAVGLPAGLPRRKVFVGVGNAAIMLFAEFVVRRVRIGVAPQPELLDKGVALFIVRQVLDALPSSSVMMYVTSWVSQVLYAPFNSCFTAFCASNCSLSERGRFSGPLPVRRPAGPASRLRAYSSVGPGSLPEG